jgi:hypothetical protein
MDTFEWVGLVFQETRRPADDDEPMRFVHKWSGDVTLTDESEDEVKIGIFCARYVDVEGAVAEGERVFDVFDSRQDTIGYFGDLYNPSSFNFKRSIAKVACGESFTWRPNLLVLERLIIYPQYRGRSRGLIALRGLIQILRPGAGLVAMKPFPLQHEYHFKSEDGKSERERLRLDDFPANPRKAVNALRKYYARLGFSKVPRSDYMVLDPERTLRTISQLRGDEHYAMEG